MASPRLWLPSAAERDARVLLEHRHQLVQLRTRAQNGLQAMALSYGVRRRSKLWNAEGRTQLEQLPLRKGMARRREDLLRLLTQLDGWISELDQRIKEEGIAPSGSAAFDDTSRSRPANGVGHGAGVGAGGAFPASNARLAPDYPTI